MARKTAVTKRFNRQKGIMEVVATKVVSVADYPEGAGPKVVTPAPAKLSTSGDHVRDLRRVLHGY